MTSFDVDYCKKMKYLNISFNPIENIVISDKARENVEIKIDSTNSHYLQGGVHVPVYIHKCKRNKLYIRKYCIKSKFLGKNISFVVSIET